MKIETMKVIELIKLRRRIEEQIARKRNLEMLDLRNKMRTMAVAAGFHLDDVLGPRKRGRPRKSA